MDTEEPKLSDSLLSGHIARENEDKMLALMKERWGEGLKLVERGIPEIGAGDVLIRVAAGSICGSDLLIEEERHPSSPPFVMGHEFSGVIERLGEGVEGFSEGDRVVPETALHTCGECPFCRRGDYHLCIRKRVLGIGGDGGFAEFVRVPAGILHRIPEGIPTEDAAPTEPCAVTYHAIVGRGRVKGGESAIVLGTGPIGLYAVQILKALGAHPVVAVGRTPWKMEMSVMMGATLAVNSEELARREVEIKELTGGAGFDAVVECSGSPLLIQHGFGFLAKGGRFIVIGITGDGAISVPWDDLVFGLGEIVFSLSSHRRDWEAVLGMMGKGEIRTSPLITHRFPLKRWEEAFGTIRRREGLKVLLIPGGGDD